MMKSVLISINPRWCELIASGEKTVDVRKTRPKLQTPFKCLIYETKGKTEVPSFIDEDGHIVFQGRGQVIGEFVCDYITMADVVLNDRTGWYVNCMHAFDGSTLDEGDILSYGAKERTLYGWHISNLVIYDTPKKLSEFMKPCENDLYCEEYAMYSEFEKRCGNEALRIKRPPQSWCYVEGAADDAVS